MLCTYPELLGRYRIQVVRFTARNRLSSTRTARSAALAVLPYLMLPCLKGGETASNGGYDWHASRTRIKDQLFGVSTGPFWSALFADCVLLLIVITYRCLPNYSYRGRRTSRPGCRFRWPLTYTGAQLTCPSYSSGSALRRHTRGHRSVVSRSMPHRHLADTPSPIVQKFVSLFRGFRRTLPSGWSWMSPFLR